MSKGGRWCRWWGTLSRVELTADVVLQRRNFDVLQVLQQNLHALFPRVVDATLAECALYARIRRQHERDASKNDETRGKKRVHLFWVAHGREWATKESAFTVLSVLSELTVLTSLPLSLQLVRA